MKRPFFIIFLLFLVVYILPLGLRPLGTPDETRYAEVPREMIDSGDWVVPRLVGVRYFEKPPAGYWAIASSIRVLGENRFAVRFPSALATLLAALALVYLVRRELLAPHVAWITACIFLANGYVFAIGTFAVLDPVFSALLTGVLACFYCAWTETHRRRTAWLAATGILVGLAFLTKGLLALAIPAVAIAPFLLWQRDRRSLFTLPWIPLAAAALVLLPWAILIHHREPDFWNYFICQEHLERFFKAMQRSRHPEPFWFLVPFLVGGILPWTFLIPASIRNLIAARPLSPLLRYALCWTVFPLLLLSCSRGKLGTYVLPCVAPLSLLIAAGLSRAVEQNKPDRWIRIACGIWAVLSVALVAALIISQTVLKPEFRLFAAYETDQVIIALIALCATSALAIRATSVSLPKQAVCWLAASMVPILMAAPWILPAHSAEGRVPEGIIESHLKVLKSAGTVYSTGHFAPAIAWYTKRTDIHLVAAGEMTYGIQYPEARHRLETDEDLKRILSDPTRTSDCVFMIHTKWYTQRINDLPRPDYKATLDGFVLLQYKAPAQQTNQRADLSTEIAP